MAKLSEVELPVVLDLEPSIQELEKVTQAMMNFITAVGAAFSELQESINEMRENREEGET